MLQEQARSSPHVELVVVDIAMRWRSIHEQSRSRRVVAGARQLARAVVDLSLTLLRRRPDLVHLRSSGGLGAVRDLVLMAITRAVRLPLVVQLHFGRIPQIAASNSVEWRLLAQVMRHATTVIVLDKATESAIRSRLPGVAVTRMPNGVDLDGLPDVGSPGEHDGPRTVLFVGWVLASKGVEDLLVAWRDVADPGWELVVAGPCDETYLEALRSMFAPLTGVSFVGELAHPAVLRMMAACDIFVLPSHTEGFPNVVAEAMAMGRAVLSTDVGAVGEMLDDRCGVVVAPGRPAELSSALATLMAEPSHRRELGDRARSRAFREYSLASVFDRYLELWHRAGAGRGAAQVPVPADQRSTSAMP
ncbi:glycosyltransferase family 4 protein [Micromonospora purpureochromogenes]|uniref:glycosyltransferase family 4 protein n=1 Tax=Micromonospora purpureochromogenes TaxID=47872 RepID=UPI0033E5ED07